MTTQSIHTDLAHTSLEVTKQYLEVFTRIETRNNLERDLKHSSLDITSQYVKQMEQALMELDEQKKAIGELTNRLRSAQGLTQEQFGLAVCELLGLESSKQAVNNWECARQTPAYLFLIGVLSTTTDWRKEWAQGCLAVLRPDLWGTQVEGTEGEVKGN